MRAASIMVAPEDAALVKRLANYAMQQDTLMRLPAHFGVSVDIIASAIPAHAVIIPANRWRAVACGRSA